MLSFGEAVRRFYGNYVNAEGRAQRSAYWWVQLYQLILIVVFCIIILMAEGGLSLIEATATMTTFDEFTVQWADLGFSGKAATYCILIFSLVNFLPGIMLNIRRFHDLDRTGWLVLFFFIVSNLPVIGIIASLVNIVWFIFPGTEGPNKYGPDPLGPNTDVFG